MLPFNLNFEVRDYECDLQQVVNHSVYLHYLEHTRHKFLEHVDLSFASLVTDDINLVVAQMNVKYHKSLKSQDRFVSVLQITKWHKVKIVFNQKILIAETLYLDAKVTVVATDNTGKLRMLPKGVQNKLSQYS